MSKSREQVQSWLNTIDITGKDCIDIGAGAKEHWACNWTKGTPKSYVTADIDSSFGCDLTMNLNIQGDIITNYDVVFCLETLEHVYDPVSACFNLYESTRPGGVCYISVPFINPIHDNWDYLRYTQEWFEKVLPYLGFTFMKILVRSSTVGGDELLSFYIKEGMKMSKSRLRNGEGSKMLDIGYIVEAHR